jgi:thiosulfate dehydrogenase
LNNLSTQKNEDIIKRIYRTLILIGCVLTGICIALFLIVYPPSVNIKQPNPEISAIDTNAFWKPASVDAIRDSEMKKLVLYGKELIQHTSDYLGPKGKVNTSTNGMNCQNCHLEAGTKIWGNNYGAVFATYPKYRARSGTIEDIFKRVNDCIERSLNGLPLDTQSTEMLAIKAYIEYIGKDAPAGKKPKGTGIKDLPFLNRPIDPVKGKKLFAATCERCHGKNGEGIYAESKTTYTYPPLWGKHSYNTGAGLFRMSRFAGYIKYNMPQGATFESPQLSDEDAWDIAAFVNSQPRPSKNLSADWPTISEKPIDHPFGPYSDSYTEQQHKYGPFKPIEDSQKSIAKK